MITQNVSSPALNPSFYCKIRSAVSGRTSGPGGLYNVGNFIALFGGFVVFYLFRAPLEQETSILWAYLFGNVATSCLTLSILLFFLGGEAYHRAFDGETNRNQNLVKLGDFLSGIAAVVLTLALVQFGETRFAIAAGLLLAGGKFGSVIFPDKPGESSGTMGVPYAFRMMVVASRLPSIAALGITLYNYAFRGGDLTDTMLAMILLICYLLWLAADCLLIALSRTSQKITITKAL